MTLVSLLRRLGKLEAQRAPQRLSHEAWLEIIGTQPMSEGESATLNMCIKAEDITEFGSLEVTDVAARAKTAGVIRA